MTLIKDLPIELQKLATKEQVRQGNKPDVNLDLRIYDEDSGNFNWGDSELGCDFWGAVDDGKFDLAKEIYDWGSEGEKERKKIRTFDSGSKRDDDSNKPLVNHLDAYVRLRFGYRLREGATKYDKGNWRKLQPVETCLESLHRHLALYELNMQNEVEQDEDHLVACLFNIMLIMKQEEKSGIKVDHYFGTTK